MGTLPAPSALAGLATFTPGPLATSASAAAASALGSAHPSESSPLPHLTPKDSASGAVILSSALPPIGARLAGKIRSRQFVAMKELLADNMALHGQLEDLPSQAGSASRPHRFREIDSPLTWVFCFLAYVAVQTEDAMTRDMLTYARLVIREAQCHGGPGWLEYDKWFRQQQASLAVPHPWHELNASLHAATVMSLRSGLNRSCRLCRGPDHVETQCALASLQPGPPSSLEPQPMTSSPGMKRVVRPETLERICSSWNKGRCAFPGSCRFRHVCATCRSKGHRAKECDDTPADSQYKALANVSTGSRAKTGSSAQ